ncbi:hypothetical protein AcV5_003645 [Taiwanofungus camphoratus]|nr:hypothetical protein AcV5_003645 [Antrodia cinnamomea]
MTNPATVSCTSILLSPSRTSTLTNANMDGGRDRPPGGMRHSGTKMSMKVQRMVDECDADPQGNERFASPHALDKHRWREQAKNRRRARFVHGRKRGPKGNRVR